MLRKKDLRDLLYEELTTLPSYISPLLYVVARVDAQPSRYQGR